MNYLKSGTIFNSILLILLISTQSCFSETQKHPTTARQPTKLALLVGINEYESPKINDLSGAVNDVRNMESLLVGKYNFSPENIAILLDKEATHEGIIKAFEKSLIKRAQDGDIVVFYYSGHGSQMPDVSGDEIDNYDETIVPHDSRDLEGSNFDISDDQINGLLYALSKKTKNITFIYDSCHSGSGVRGIGTPRQLPPDTARGLPPQKPLYARNFQKDSRGDSDLRPDSLDYVLISAAAFNQRAEEQRISGKGIQGLLTHYLVEALWSADDALTYRDVMDNVVAKVRAANRNQIPQLEGSQEHHYVFSDSLSIARPYILAKPRSNDPSHVTLQAGKIQGLTVDSKYKIYAPGTKDFHESVMPIAKIKLVEVKEYYSKGVIIEGSKIPRQARAVAYEHRFGEKQLHINYSGLNNSPLLQSLKGKLDNISFISEQNHTGSYHLSFKNSAGGISMEISGATDEAKLYSIQNNDLTPIVDDVIQWARWFHLLSIENPSPPFTVDFQLEASQGGTTRSPFVYVGKAENVLYPQEKLKFKIKNTSNQNLYFTILDLASDNSISVIYQSNQTLPPGESWEASTGVSVPDGLHSITDIVKVFLTTRKLDFKTLLQAPISTRTTAQTPPDDPLAQLFTNAISGTRSTRSVNTSSWSTVQRVITVKKNN